MRSLADLNPVIIGIVLVAAVATFLLVNERSPEPDNVLSVEQEALVTPPKPSGSGTSLEHVDSAISLRSDESKGLSESEALEQKAWEESRGFMTEEHRYLRRLSDSELDVLIAQGNLRAMRVRAGRLLGDPQMMFSLFEKAIVLGDVPALLTAASVWRNYGIKSGNRTLYASDDPYVNTLAIMLAARLRGDNVLVVEWQERLLQDIDMTEEQILEACAGASSILSQLELERARLGLPPFDNTPSPHGENWNQEGPLGSTCG